MEEAQKTFTVTLRQSVNAELALVQLAAIRMPVKVGYHITRLLGFIRKEAKFWNDEQAKLFEELGDLREPTEEESKRNGGQKIREIRADSEKWPEFKRRLDELSGHEVTIPWVPLQLEELGELVIEPSVLDALGPCLTGQEHS